MKILIDSREQAPYTFERYDCQTQRATLPAGDYSLPGFEDKAAVERKELNDLLSCFMGTNRERFERELQKGRFYDMFVVVCECSLADITNAQYRSNMKPQAALQSIISFQVRYGVFFQWAGDRRGGELITFSILSKYIYEIEKRYRTAFKVG